MAHDGCVAYDERMACDEWMAYDGRITYDGRMISAAQSYYKKTKAILIYFIKNAFNMKRFMI